MNMIKDFFTVVSFCIKTKTPVWVKASAMEKADTEDLKWLAKNLKGETLLKKYAEILIKERSKIK